MRSRLELLPYLDQEVLVEATLTDLRRQAGPQPPLTMIRNVRLVHAPVYIEHLWVVLPRDVKVKPNARFRFEGVVVRYQRPDLTDSFTISRIELL